MDLDGMYVFDIWLELQHTMWVGLQTNVFETVLCLQIWADLISLWRQRLEEDLAGGEKTVKKCLIMFGMHSEGTGTCDLASLQRKLFWRPHAFKGKKASNHLTAPYPQGKQLHQWTLFPVLRSLPSHSRAHCQRQGPAKKHLNYVYIHVKLLVK